ncbi:hypothetical protein T492DRAFT_288726 [Pavlovales sp. CCMP2436]|nr:hypothetical protein T492DRAFT_288726 [Pavlovales sp. CCMP2436]
MRFGGAPSGMGEGEMLQMMHGGGGCYDGSSTLRGAHGDGSGEARNPRVRLAQLVMLDPQAAAELLGTDEVLDDPSPKPEVAPRRKGALFIRRPFSPVPGSREQLPGLWPDGKALPRLTAAMPRAMPFRPKVHAANNVSKMALSTLLGTPALRKLYFAAAGHAMPRPLQPTRDEPLLHSQPDQLVRLVYWQPRAPPAGAPAGEP